MRRQRGGCVTWWLCAVVVCDNRGVLPVTPRRLDADSFWLLVVICILNFYFEYE